MMSIIPNQNINQNIITNPTTNKTTIPNTLTIFVNTRIRNHRSLKYTPSMTIPNEKSTTVCFDPLVQITRSAVDSIPPGYPKEEIYTQFFRRNEFTSLVSRSLNTFPLRANDLLSAKYQGIVDSNIRIVLDTLFKRGAPFYIGKDRFTVNSYEWFNGDWQIGTKIFEQSVISPYTNTAYASMMPFVPSTGAFLGSMPGVSISSAQVISPINAQIGINELNDIPEDAIKGIIPSQTSKIQKAITLNSGIKTVTATNASPSTGLSSLFPMPNLMNPGTNTTGPPPPSYLNPDAKKAIEQIQEEIDNLLHSHSPISPVDRLHLNFINAYNEGIRKDLINPGKPGKNSQVSAYVDQIKNWQITPNNGSGDCLFYAIADILNSNQNQGHILAPHDLQVDPSTGQLRATPLPQDRYIDKAANAYTVRTLRTAFVDCLRNIPNIFNQYVDIGKQDNALSPVRWRFMRNDADTVFLHDADILRVLSIPADPTLRDPAIDGPELVGANRYYWGDELALQCFEAIFQVKFIVITTQSRENNPVHIANRVKFTTDAGESKIGIAVSDQRMGIIVELEDYTHVNIEEKQVDKGFRDENYSVYCYNNLEGTNFAGVTNFALLLYNPMARHFESLCITIRNKVQYIYESVAYLPSYIKYMIFLYCYRFILDAQKSTSSFGIMPGFASDFGKCLRIIDEKIAEASLPEEDKKNKQISTTRKLQYGGAAGPGTVTGTVSGTSLPMATPVNVASTAPVQAIPVAQLSPLQQSQITGAKQDPRLMNITGKYLQETPQFAAYDSRIGYYIIIDLELYPGDEISLGRGVVIGCDNRYEKIWTAMSDIFGIPYQPKEIAVPQKQLGPNSNPNPSPNPNGTITQSSKKEGTLYKEPVSLQQSELRGGRNLKKNKRNTKKRYSKMQSSSLKKTKYNRNKNL